MVKSLITVLGLLVGIASCEDEGCEQTTSNCCKVCTDSKPCGDSCIARNQTCSIGGGCACSGATVDSN